MRCPVAVLLLISCFFVKVAGAQTNELNVLGQTGNLHLEHTVVAKENWYSVGRLYNITPKELTAYNKVALTQPLVIGQTLEVPLTTVNFSQNGQKGAGETLVPVYHVVQEKEWMYRISVNHNKVPMASLEKWNSINKDQVRAGMHLVVGYLRVKTGLSALAKPVGAAATGVAVAGSGVPAPAAGGVSKDGGVSGTKDGGGSGTKTTKVSERVPAKDEGDSAQVPERSEGNDRGKARDDGFAKVPASPAVGKTKGSEGSTSGGGSVSGGGSLSGGGSVSGGGSAASSHNGGVFKGDFTESGKSASGVAGTFKSTSGWQDGKYYALMNNISVGTIVKVSDSNTGKTVYAKVLGALPDMKESAGLAVRISNAAASELGEGEGRFNVSVSY